MPEPAGQRPPGDATTRALRRAALGASWPWTVVTTGDDRTEASAAIVAVFRGEERRLDSLEAFEAFLEHARSLIPVGDEP